MGLPDMALLVQLAMEQLVHPEQIMEQDHYLLVLPDMELEQQQVMELEHLDLVEQDMGVEILV